MPAEREMLLLPVLWEQRRLRRKLCCCFHHLSRSAAPAAPAGAAGAAAMAPLLYHPRRPAHRALVATTAVGTTS